MRLLRAELGRFARPLTALVVLGMIALSLLWGGIYRQMAASSLEGAEVGNRIYFENPPTCADYDLEPGPSCDEELGQYRIEAANWLVRIRREASTMKTIQSGLGAGTFAANMMASGLGVLAIAFLAVMATAGDWQLGTTRYVLLQDGRRGRLILAKILATVVVGVVILLAIAVAMALAGLAFNVVWPLPSAGLSALDLLAGSVVSIGRALPVIIAFAALGVVAGTLTRSPLGGYAASVGVVLASWMLSGLGAIEKFTLTRWVRDWMGFERGLGLAVDHLWPDVFLGREPYVGLVGLTLMTLIFAVVGVIAARRSPV